LTATQKTAAASLGFTTNLPNATGAYLGQTTQAVNTFTGATNNTVTLSQTNLPAVNFTGTSGGGGNHQHTVDPAPINSGWAGSHSHTISPKILDPLYGWVLVGVGMVLLLQEQPLQVLHQIISMLLMSLQQARAFLEIIFIV
jgi:hypothetical protein